MVPDALPEHRRRAFPSSKVNGKTNTNLETSVVIPSYLKSNLQLLLSAVAL
uniref:Uncharacterized protein n=1 Tax=Physcomitrium patens TaxID=3218 RepID=A0A7I4F9T5_PHYPA